MRCQEFLAQMDDYIDSLSDEKARVEMQEHAKGCAACGEALRHAERLRDMLGNLDKNICAPLEAQGAWRRAIRGEEKLRSKRKPWKVWMKAASGIAAAFVLMVGLTVAFRATGMLRVESISADSQETTQMLVADGGAVGNVLSENRAMVLESDGASTDSAVLDMSADVANTLSGATALPETGHVFAKSAVREMQTNSFDSDYALIGNLVEEYNGYVKSEVTEKDAVGRITTITASVPAEDATAFLSSLEHTAEIVRREDNAEDISSMYYDAQSRLDALQAEKERLLQLIDVAENAEEIADLQSSLQDVYASIDAVYSTIAGYRGRLENMEIRMVLYEGTVRTLSQSADSSLGNRMAKAFRASSAFLEDMLVSVAVIAPFVLVLIGIVLVAGIAVLCTLRIHRK